MVTLGPELVDSNYNNYNVFFLRRSHQVASPASPSLGPRFPIAEAIEKSLKLVAMMHQNIQPEPEVTLQSCQQLL